MKKNKLNSLSAGCAIASTNKTIVTSNRARHNYYVAFVLKCMYNFSMFDIDIKFFKSIMNIIKFIIMIISFTLMHSVEGVSCWNAYMIH